MQLLDLINGLEIVNSIGTLDRQVGNIHFDSRQVENGDVFVAIPGTQVDGHKYIPTAIRNGASTIISEHIPSDRSDEATYIITSSSRRAVAVLAGNYYGHPSRKLTLIGVTGTNGKTTIATTLHKLFSQLGYKVGLLSTIRNLIGNTEIPSTHTTADAIQVENLLSRMLNEDCTHCFMEVSSHALDQDRVAGLNFNIAIFTNLTRDHLDYHGTLANYAAAKKKLFLSLDPSAYALVNSDDAFHMKMTDGSKGTLKTYSLETEADFRCKIQSQSPSGSVLEINHHSVTTLFPGRFNASNITAVVAAALLLGESMANIVSQVEALKPPEGRFQTLTGKSGVLVVIDFAHTPDGLKAILSALKPFANTREGRIITILGCGGDRDQGKRAEMAKVASAWSDIVILTSDNPRSEDPLEIIAAMKSGLPRGFSSWHENPDRKAAIKLAREIARPEDIVLVAGKGHEKYQEIAGQRYPFDDYKEAMREFS